MSTSHIDPATTNSATTDPGVSSDNCVTTTLGDQMTFTVYKSAMNYALAIKDRFHSKIDHGIISDEQHKFLLSVTMRVIFKPSTAKLYADDF